jgi:hypothetical protein
MKSKTICSLSFLALVIYSTPVVARETNELITRDKLNIERCKEDFATCTKISEAANVAFGAYVGDGKEGRPKEDDGQWKKRFEKELKEPGAGWDKGYQKVDAVVVSENNAEFVIAQKKVVIGMKIEGMESKEVTKTYYMIGIRGTQQGWDWATNFSVSPEKFNGTEVHGGFYRYAQSIIKSPEFKQLVEDIVESKDEAYEVLITGHSLGGAAATIVKAELENILRQKGFESSISKVSAITFGAPHVGDQRFANKYGDRVSAIGATGDGVQILGVNAYPVGKPYDFRFDDKSYLNTSEQHASYSKAERYESAVKNGWYDLRNSLMQNSLTGITQGSSSHIGSAAYYLGRSSDNDPRLTEDLMASQNAMKVEKFSVASTVSAQQREEYTSAGSITNLKAPVDVVLNWDKSIAAGQLDLDSHLTGPTSLGPDSQVRFHTNFSDKGSITAAPYVQLYRDVIPAGGGTGDEQTRIQVLQDGIYRFYVHDYTNRGTSEVTALSPALAQSGANVTVYTAGIDLPQEGQNINRNSALGGAINVPTDGRGNVWYTFQLDSRTGILKRVLVPFGNERDRALVPRIGEAPPTMTLPR